MKITLDYGRSGLEVNLPDDRTIGPLAIKDAAPLADPEAALRQALTNPIGSKPLAELAKGKKNACILICDITRPVPNKLILPPVLKTLEEAGIPRREICILNATGLHRPNEGAELVEMVGEEIVKNYRIENHHGKVLRGAHLSRHDAQWRAGLDRHALREGRPEDHYRPDRTAPDGRLFGRPQGYLPGHRRPGNRQGLARPEVPRTSARRLRQPRSAIPSTKRTRASPRWPAATSSSTFASTASAASPGLALGDMIEAWEAGVQFCQDIVKVGVPQAMDVVVTSCAGYPLDTTWYQAVKGLTGACRSSRRAAPSSWRRV